MYWLDIDGSDCSGGVGFSLFSEHIASIAETVSAKSSTNFEDIGGSGFTVHTGVVDVPSGFVVSPSKDVSIEDSVKGSKRSSFSLTKEDKSSIDSN